MTIEEYKSERTKRGLSQVALAALVGVRQGTISDRETGRAAITQEAAMAIRSLPIPSKTKRPKAKGQNSGISSTKKSDIT